jgi:hypothetical protein
MRKIRDLSCFSKAASAPASKLAVKAALVVVAACASLGVAGSAHAETPAHGQFGLGIADTLGGPTGLNGVFDAGVWHAELTMGLSSSNSTSRIDLAGHGWFHLHTGASSDFSVGGGLSMDRLDPPGDRPAGGGSNAVTTIGIDLGFQIRAFLTANVAISATGGLSVLTGDGDGFVFGGQPIGAFSFTYFF